MSTRDRHIELVVAVNNAATEKDHRRAEDYLRAWRDGVTAALGWGPSERGQLLTDADLHYINQDPTKDWCMCGGVWLDWEPADPAAKEQT